jgi:hypothetical protein
METEWVPSEKHRHAEAREVTETGPRLLGGLALGLFCAYALRIAQKDARPAPRPQPPAFAGPKRALHGSAALLATSVLIDSAIEHYRGSFKNPGMYVPLLSSSLALLSGAEGAATGHASLRSVRRGAYKMAIVAGTAGTAFHIYNVFRRPGGLGWLNLFYGAPLGAPAALTVSGLLGLCAEELEPSRKVSGILSRGRAIAALTSAALAGTVAEVALLHFRGAFQNPFMWAPVTLPPVAAGLMAKAAAERPARRYPLTKIWLWLTAALGFLGTGFHAYGVSRAMGGWRNWSQNVLDGPPLPAPPSFSALSIASLAALSLLEGEAQEIDEARKTA